MSETGNRDRRGHGKKGGIWILQHNIQRSKTVPYEISIRMDADGDDILLIQELYSFEGKIPYHRILETLLDFAKRSTMPQLQERRYNTQKANWEEFQRAVMEGTETLKEITLQRAEDVERMAEQLQVTLIRACDAAIQKKKWHYRSVPWWTPELTRAKRSTYQARRRYQGVKDLATREQEKLRYRETRKEYQRMISRTKVQSWQDFFTKEDNRESWGIAYRTVTGKLRREETISTLKTPQADTSNWRVPN